MKLIRVFGPACHRNSTCLSNFTPDYQQQNEFPTSGFITNCWDMSGNHCLIRKLERTGCRPTCSASRGLPSESPSSSLEWRLWRLQKSSEEKTTTWRSKWTKKLKEKPKSLWKLRYMWKKWAYWSSSVLSQPGLFSSSSWSLLLKRTSCQSSTTPRYSRKTSSRYVQKSLIRQTFIRTWLRFWTRETRGILTWSQLLWPSWRRDTMSRTALMMMTAVTATVPMTLQTLALRKKNGMRHVYTSSVVAWKSLERCLNQRLLQENGSLLLSLETISRAPGIGGTSAEWTTARRLAISTFRCTADPAGCSEPLELWTTGSTLLVREDGQWPNCLHKRSLIATERVTARVERSETSWSTRRFKDSLRRGATYTEPPMEVCRELDHYKTTELFRMQPIPPLRIVLA